MCRTARRALFWIPCLRAWQNAYSLQLAQNSAPDLRDESFKKSQTVGGCNIIGYKVNPDTKRYEVDPKTAPFVIEVFKRYANGETISEIVAWLNVQGSGQRAAASSPSTACTAC